MDSAPALPRYRLAIFDFDGTLADSFPFFARVFNQLAARHGFRSVESHEVAGLRRCGPREIMARLEMPAWKLPLVARSFVAMMKDDPAGVPLFAGVTEVLRELRTRGVLLAIVSSNSRENLERTLGSENLSLISHTECGVSIFGKRARIRKVLKKAAVAAADAIYIGDQTTDGEAAREENVAFGAVSWGYGHVDALRACSPEYVFKRPADITRIAHARDG